MGRCKTSKITNKEMMKQIIECIKEFGYHPYDITLGNCYFVFEGNDDSICHFKIKEIPGFLFGLWSTDRFDTLEYQMKNNLQLWSDSFEIDSKSEVVFFTQYLRDIDKFKPSRSGFVTGLSRDAWEEENENGEIIKKEEWYVDNLENILHYMKKHRIRCVEYVSCMTRYIWEDDRSSIHLGLIFIKDWIYTYKCRFKKWLRLKCLVFISKHFANKIKMSNVLVVDWGETWSPRIHIYIRRKDEINLKVYKQEQVYIDSFEDKYINDIGIVQFDIDILANDLTDDDFNKDKELKEKFYSNVKTYHNNKIDEDGSKFLYENI